MVRRSRSPNLPHGGCRINEALVFCDPSDDVMMEVHHCEVRLFQCHRHDDEESGDEDEEERGGNV